MTAEICRAPSLRQDTAVPRAPSQRQDTAVPRAPSLRQDTAVPRAPSQRQDTAVPRAPSLRQDTGSPPGTKRPPAGSVTIVPVRDLGEVRPGDDLAGMLCAAATFVDGDVVVVTQKVVSKAEGRLVRIDPEDTAARRQLAESEAVRVLRRRGDLVITETRHGFVCANSGIDLSNVDDGWAALLPEDPDRSARRLRDAIGARSGAAVAVIVSDTFGRTWRRGVTDVAIGCAGIAAVVDLRGTTDALGRTLLATEICVADELAGAAELVMGKASGIAAAIVRGVERSWLRRGSVAEEVVRPYGEDLFR
jgi:coenzyme F420-0:L-glutamate ligase/coenzyme F420-1:gamma-L-glutamate ligase